MSLARSSTPFLWTAYILLPVGGWGVFHGAPAGGAGLVALFAIWWIWLSGGKLPGLAMAILLLVKLVAGSFSLVDRGMEAAYFADAQFAGPTEQSTDYPGRRYTRIDRRLAFGGAGEPDIPLYFFNDSSRFNFFRTAGTDRATLPFSVAWRGYARSFESEDSRIFYLRGRKVAAQLWIDGSEIARLEPSAQEALGKARWPVGARHVVVYLSSKSGGGRQFEAGFVKADGTRTPFSESDLVTRTFPSWRLTTDWSVRYLSVAIDSALVAVLMILAGMSLGRVILQLRSAERRDALVALSWVASMTMAIVYSLPAAHRLILLEGGSDELVYESSARDIALHGPLMLHGHPLYSYILALAHLLFGEDLFGVHVVQWMMAFGVVLMVWRITRTLFGVMFGRMGLALAGIFFVTKLVPLSGALLNENLLITLLMGLTLLMIQMTMPGSTPRRRKSLGLVVVVLAAAIAVEVLQSVRIATVPFARNLIANAVYTLGDFSPLEPGGGLAPGLIATWCAALIGVGMVARDRVPEGLHGPVRALPAALGVSLLLIVITLLPHVHGSQFVLPVYMLLLPYAALGAMRTLDFLVPPQGRA